MGPAWTSVVIILAFVVLFAVLNLLEKGRID